MTLTFPYPLAFLSDTLDPSEVSFELMRRDEMSGTGDGRVWSQELAKPIWRISMSLVPQYVEDARATDAKLMALEGARESFLFADPSYRLAGSPGAGVTLSAVSSDRKRISLTGLPAGWPIKAGQRFSINWGSGRVHLGVFAESITGGSGGNLGNIAVAPWLPMGIASGSLVEMSQPLVRVFIPEGGHRPFTAYGAGIASGGSLTLLQRI